MAGLRKPFQGVANIVRFNRHFFLLAVMFVLALLGLSYLLTASYVIYTTVICIVVMAATVIPLIVSWYVYDLSDLYSLNWLDVLNIRKGSSIVNINAGFDETSILLDAKYEALLQVFDFYDAKKHKEVSIKRARKAYPPYPGTIAIHTAYLPLADNTIDYIFVVLAAHEIRNDAERIVFFKLLNKALTQAGKLIITEHLRDLPNLLAYNIGFFHFLSKKNWLKTFHNAGFHIAETIKITPFITSFILEKNGAAS